jgi:hypothetical protein
LAETLGTLVDKLSVTNLKLFAVQDRVHQAAQAGEGLEPDTVAKLHALNQQRNGLMAELDMLLSKAIETGTVEVNPQIKLY